MNVAIVGCGHVGLVTGACLAKLGNTVVCVDSNEQKIYQLKNNIMPIYEPGLQELVEENTREGKLSFQSDLKGCVETSEIIFIAVGTPLKKDGSPDLSQLERTGKQIAGYINDYKIIVVRSTVPVGITHKFKILISTFTKHDFDIANNPEFLKEGTAVDDFLKPDRIVLGVESNKAEKKLLKLYRPFAKDGKPVYTMDIKSSEMTKYAANAMLSTKISFINEIASLCEYLGADIDQIRKGICSDMRIGRFFLDPGIGYGGSCLPKDVQALCYMAKEKGYEAKLLESVHKTNEYQKQLLVTKIKEYYGTDLTNIHLAIWGLAFKPGTDDTRGAPSLTVLNSLLACGANLKVHDPKAKTNIYEIYGNILTYCSDPYDALESTDALCVLTEWDIYKNVDFKKIRKLMRQPVIFDGRNIYLPEQLKTHGFTYFSIGRAPVNFEKQNPVISEQAIAEELIW